MLRTRRVCLNTRCRFNAVGARFARESHTDPHRHGDGGSHARAPGGREGLSRHHLSDSLAGDGSDTLHHARLERRRNTSAPRSFFATLAVVGFQMC